MQRDATEAGEEVAQVVAPLRLKSVAIFPLAMAHAALICTHCAPRPAPHLRAT